MGVKKLWPTLEPAGQPVRLSDLRGFRVAVDLPHWICELSQVTTAQGEKLTAMKPHIRNLFWRVHALLRHQVRPVFVLDGAAPSVKRRALEARRAAAGREKPSSGGAVPAFNRSDSTVVRECRELLECLGVPCIESSGEAEALCAQLDRDGLVDGCITGDGDAFLYGANTVYRNFSCSKNKQAEMRVFHASEVAARLGLDRARLVALALLVGSDYTDGARGVGPERALRLLGKDGTLRPGDVLARLRSWRADAEGEFARHEEFQTMSHPQHCSKCGHEGSVVQHKAKGCAQCHKDRTCVDGGAECACQYHVTARHMTSLDVEAKIRRAALEDPTFPSEDVINEYLNPRCDPVEPFESVQWRKPDYMKLKKYLMDEVRLKAADAQQRAHEVLASWSITHAHAQSKQRSLLRILRVRKERILHAVPTLEVLWEGMAGKEVITYEDRETMVKTFPRAVEVFDEEKTKAKKMGKLNKCRKRITDYFKSRRKLKFGGDDDRASSSSSSSDSMPGSPDPKLAPGSHVRLLSFSDAISGSQTPNGTGSALLPSADSLLDAPTEEFSEFLCPKRSDSGSKETPANPNRFTALKSRSGKRKAPGPAERRSAKKLRLSAVGKQATAAEAPAKLKRQGSASDSIPMSTSSSRSKSCSSDFTDGASTCSDLISDDDADDVEMALPSQTATPDDVIDLTAEAPESEAAASSRPVPVLRRSPRESVRQMYDKQKILKVAPSKKKKLRFTPGSQSTIKDYWKTTKSSGLSALRF